MNHRASPRFWRCYRGLPEEIRRLADRAYALLKADPAHRSLHFKKIASIWSVRVGLHYRALATEVNGDLVWFWVGSHAEYDKLVGRRPAPPPKAQRHRVSFDEATTVFTDPFALTFDDPDHSLGERRYVTIVTSSKHRIVFLAHVDRGEDHVRIISARPATAAEAHA